MITTQIALMWGVLVLAAFVVAVLALSFVPVDRVRMPSHAKHRAPKSRSYFVDYWEGYR